MTAKIPPDLQFSVLCDDVRIENNGKFILVGLFEAIRSRKFPVKHPILHVINRWCNGEGEFTEKTRIVNAINKGVVEGAANQFTLKSTTGVYTVVSRFANIPFEQAGTYWVEVLLDGQLQQRYPLTLVQIPEKDKKPDTEKEDEG